MTRRRETAGEGWARTGVELRLFLISVLTGWIIALIPKDDPRAGTLLGAMVVLLDALKDEPAMQARMQKP